MEVKQSFGKQKTDTQKKRKEEEFIFCHSGQIQINYVSSFLFPSSSSLFQTVVAKLPSQINTAAARRRTKRTFRSISLLFFFFLRCTNLRYANAWHGLFSSSSEACWSSFTCRTAATSRLSSRLSAAAATRCMEGERKATFEQNKCWKKRVKKGRRQTGRERARQSERAAVAIFPIFTLLRRVQLLGPLRSNQTSGDGRKILPLSHEVLFEKEYLLFGRICSHFI